MNLVRTAVSVGGLAVAAALALVARSMRPSPPLPVLGQVPAFHLVDQRGMPFTDASMRGHVGVVDFIFTRCPSSCPRLTARMADLQSRLSKGPSDVRLVSFSVDPENDTPEVLSRYAAGAHADPARWSFVTGGANDVENAVVGGFKMSAAKIAKGAGDYEVVHGEWFVLVDRKGNLRGYYPTGTDEEFATFLRDVNRVEGERH
ncbi:MAG: SCO family protein [Polyangiaceae bacterium]